jgi:hypothetical protein
MRGSIPFGMMDPQNARDGGLALAARAFQTLLLAGPEDGLPLVAASGSAGLSCLTWLSCDVMTDSQWEYLSTVDSRLPTAIQLPIGLKDCEFDRGIAWIWNEYRQPKRWLSIFRSGVFASTG